MVLNSWTILNKLYRHNKIIKKTLQSDEKIIESCQRREPIVNLSEGDIQECIGGVELYNGLYSWKREWVV